MTKGIYQSAAGKVRYLPLSCQEKNHLTHQSLHVSMSILHCIVQDDAKRLGSQPLESRKPNPQSKLPTTPLNTLTKCLVKI